MKYKVGDIVIMGVTDYNRPVDTSNKITKFKIKVTIIGYDDIKGYFILTTKKYSGILALNSDLKQGKIDLKYLGKPIWWLEEKYIESYCKKCKFKKR